MSTHAWIVIGLVVALVLVVGYIGWRVYSAHRQWKQYRITPIGELIDDFNRATGKSIDVASLTDYAEEVPKSDKNRIGA